MIMHINNSFQTITEKTSDNERKLMFVNLFEFGRHNGRNTVALEIMMRRFLLSDEDQTIVFRSSEDANDHFDQVNDLLSEHLTKGDNK